MHINDPWTHGPAPSSASTFNSTISSPPSRCSQCAEYSSRISDLEACLTLAKCQAQMVFDKASKTSNLTKQVSILDDKVSSLTVKILHHEECNSFVLGITNLPVKCCDVSFLSTYPFPFLLHCYFYDILSLHRHLF
jgi:hypothetical protein